MRKNWLVVLGATVLSGAALGADLGLPLTQEEAMALIKGHELATENTHTGGAVHLRFKEDGSLSGMSPHGADAGTWEVKDGKLCLHWRRWEYEGCGQLRWSADKTRFYHLYPASESEVHFSAAAERR